MKRDALGRKYGVRAIEMEGAGIADATWNHEAGYLVIRGISDYCDSTKGDDWQKYAAVVAAAHTHEPYLNHFLSVVQASASLGITTRLIPKKIGQNTPGYFIPGNSCLSEWQISPRSLSPWLD